MKDPLNRFNWQSLHFEYDAKCRGFDNKSVYLAAFETDRPVSDRALYYELLNVFSEKRRVLATEPIGIYEALLYWKLYSQPAAISNTVLKLREDAALRKDTQEKLLLLFQKLPVKLEKNTSAVLDIVNQLGSFKILGIKTSTALPVRTTLLHFMYPSVVPIFDKMVLQAVGVWDKHANQSTKFLMEYLPFAWALADRYEQSFSSFRKESPIRIIDMALWVGRGKDLITSRSAPDSVGKELGTDSQLEGYNSPSKNGASSVSLSGVMPRNGDVFQGRTRGKLTTWEKVSIVFNGIKIGKVFSRDRIKAMVLDAYPETNITSVIPLDYCYNRINGDKRSFEFRVFKAISDDQFEWLGEGYPYEGQIWWRNKNNRIILTEVGKWEDGKPLLAYDPRKKSVG